MPNETKRVRCIGCGKIFHADSCDLAPEGCATCHGLTALPAPALPRGFASYQPDADALDCAFELKAAIEAWRAQGPGCETDIDSDLAALIDEFRAAEGPGVAAAGAKAAAPRHPILGFIDEILAYERGAS